MHLVKSWCKKKTSTCTSGSNGQPSAPSPINLASVKWISCSTTVFYCSLRSAKTIAFAAAAINGVIELYTSDWAKRLQLTMCDDDEKTSNSFSASFNLTLSYLCATRNTAQTLSLHYSVYLCDSQIVFQVDNHLKVSSVFLLKVVRK